MKKRIFCTFFDSKYIPLGLALYNSLERHCPDFSLWILCVDDITYNLLNRLNLKNVIAVRMEDFETPELLAVKKEPKRNYLGTCKPFFISYVFDRNRQIDVLTYLDSDIYLFSSPEPIFEEFGRDNVLVVPHNLRGLNKIHEERSGRFNAGLIVFKNNETGLSCLKYWQEKCLDWCENTCLPDRYGDQKYLDEWPIKFSGIHVLKHIGAIIGPWNINQYDLKKSDGVDLVGGYPIILYHLSSLRIYSAHNILPALYSYKISRTVKKTIYKIYIAELKNIIEKLADLNPPFTQVYFKKPRFWSVFRANRMHDLISLHIYLKAKFPLYSRIFYRYIKRIRNLPS